MTSDHAQQQYCANDSDCSNPTHSFSHNDVCVMKNSRPEADYHWWEGGPQGCTFPSGVRFTWNIPNDAQSRDDYSYIGSVLLSFRLPRSTHRC